MISSRTLITTLVLVAIAGCAFAIGRFGGGGGRAAAAPDVSYSPEAAGTIIKSSEFVSPTTGWALTSARLAWTDDSGIDWQTITPPGVEPSQIRNVEFADARRGWVAVDFTPGQYRPDLTIFRTSDGGRTWSSSVIAGPRQLTIGQVWFAFSGTEGLAMVDEEDPGTFSHDAHLYRSRDGGATWSALPTPPVDGDISLSEGEESWLVGGGATRTLWRSADAGTTWSQVSVEPPAGLSAREAGYGLPQVSTDGSAVLPVVFTVGEESQAVVYAKAPEGSWRIKARTPLEGSASLEAGLTAASFPTPGTVAIEDPGTADLTTVSLPLVAAPGQKAGAVGVQASAQPSQGEVTTDGLPAPAPIQFIDAEHALAVVNQEECSSDGADCTYVNGLYLSDDGGHSWHPAPERP